MILRWSMVRSGLSRSFTQLQRSKHHQCPPGPQWLPTSSCKGLEEVFLPGVSFPGAGMVWRSQLRAPWEAARGEVLLFNKTELGCIIHWELDDSVCWIAKTATKYLKKVTHGTSGLCVFHFIDLLQIQTQAIATPWICLPPVAKYALYGNFQWLLPLWEHCIWKEHPCTIGGYMRIPAEPQFLWCKEGWRSLGKRPVFSLETKWNHFGNSTIRHQSYPFQSCSLRSQLLLSNLRGLWVYSQWPWGFWNVFKGFSNSQTSEICAGKSTSVPEQGIWSSLSYS